MVGRKTHQTQVDAGHVAGLTLTRHAALDVRHVAADGQAPVAAQRAVQLHVHLALLPELSQVTDSPNTPR